MAAVKDAEEATEIAKRYLSETTELPYIITGAKREGGYWIVTARSFGMEMRVKINSATGEIDEYSTQSV